MRSRLSHLARRRHKQQRSKSIPTLFRSHTTRPSSGRNLVPPATAPSTPKARKPPNRKKSRTNPRRTITMSRRPFSLKRAGRRKKKHARRSSTGSTAASDGWSPSLDSDMKNEPVFGIDLEVIMKQHKGKFVQPILSEICNALRRQLTTLGLFRVSPLNTELEQILQDYNQGIRPPLNSLDPHLLAGLLKEYFNHFPEPLLTFNLYSDFLEYAHDPGNRIDVLHNAVDHLSPVRKNTLSYLLDFLCEVVEEEENHMDAESIARIVTPNLLQPKEVSPMVLLQDTRVAFLVTKKLLEEKLEERVRHKPEKSSVLLCVDSGEESEDLDLDLPARKRYQTVG